jgi:GntR family transcriptional regulator
MFVTTGARVALMRDEREKFLAQEWPRVRSTIERLGLDAADLLKK